MYTRMVALKKKSNVQILLAVGGWNFGSTEFSKMVTDDRLRTEFVDHATQFLLDKGFDGLDLDWVGQVIVRRDTCMFSWH
jgi:chitinase